MKKYIKPAIEMVEFEGAAIMVGSVKQEQGNGVQLEGEIRRGSDWSDFEN